MQRDRDLHQEPRGHNSVMHVKEVSGITHTLYNFEVREKTTADLYQATAESILMKDPSLGILDVKEVEHSIRLILNGETMDRSEDTTTLADLGVHIATVIFVVIDRLKLTDFLNSVRRTWIGGVVRGAAKALHSFRLKINDASEESRDRLVSIALADPDEELTPGLVETIVHDTIMGGYYSAAVKDHVRRGVMEITYGGAGVGAGTGMTLGSVFESGVRVVVNVYSFSIKTNLNPDPLVLGFDAIPSDYRGKKAILKRIEDVCVSVLVEGVNTTHGPHHEYLTRIMETVMGFDETSPTRFLYKSYDNVFREIPADPKSSSHFLAGKTVAAVFSSGSLRIELVFKS
jgi:hypothetical protein